MSWLSIPLPNPFKSLQFSDDDEQQQLQEQHSPPRQNDAVSPGIGVKDDLSAIGETIGRQLRGVAAFLAPPPRPELAGDSSFSGEGSSPSSRTFAGIRSDLAEIGGTFKTSLSLLSTNNAVTGISKLASSFLQLNEENNYDDKEYKNDDDDDGNDDEGAGITDEVVGFARQISDRPELWTDFPLSLNQEFDMSDVQSEHASAIEQLVPSLSDLRSRLSCDMSDNHFWMIYFILLLPRLNDDDFELFSTPEIVEARETLLLMLRNKGDTETDSENPQLGGSSELGNKVDDTAMENSNVSRSIESNESNNTKQLIIEEDGNKCSSSDDPNQSVAKADGSGNKEHENVDNCLVEDDEEDCVTTRTSNTGSKRFQSEDDVSFSDLEDDDNDLLNRQSGSRPAQSTRGSSPEGSNEWVQLNRNVGNKDNQLRGQSSSRERFSEGEESNDWLTVDDFYP